MKSLLVDNRKIEFTDHALEKLKRIGKSKEEVLKIIDNNKPIREEVQRVKRYYELDEKYNLIVVIDIRKEQIVTVYKELKKRK